jgi:hypothetical protein
MKYKNINARSRLTKSAFPYERGSNDGYNYLWQLMNLGDVIPAFAGMTILKDGFAQRTYSTGKNGVESRVKNTVIDIENKLGIKKGTLVARIIYAKEGTYNDTLSAEQYFHKKNKAWKIQSLLHGFTQGIKLGKEFSYKNTISGSSEFYNMPLETAKAKFANAWRVVNRKIGLDTVEWKRENGINGCPVGGSGIGDEEPTL